MKLDKKKIAAAASELLKEVELNSDIITAVINEKIRDRNIVASISLGHVSYEIWKRKNGEFDVVKSSYPKEHTDFKKIMSKKQISEDFLVDILDNTIKAFVVDKDERKRILEKLNANK
jgi:hypothetical protein